MAEFMQGFIVFLVRVQYRRKESSRSLSHLLMCFLFIKLFKASDMHIVKYCQQCFSFDMPSDLWEKRARTFERKFSEFCQYIPWM